MADCDHLVHPEHWPGDAGDLGRYCTPCAVARHGDCRPHGCSAQRDGDR